MNISPFYDEIKTRAVELLTRPAGFIGHSQDEIRSWRKRDRLLRNAIGVAICVAHDEIAGSLRTEIDFNKANFRKAEAEIARTFLPR